MAMVEGMHTYECRLASFEITHSIAKKRASNANNKGKKTVHWPHVTPSPAQLAKAGFFYRPTASTPDNVSCFLCQKNLDGWEENDIPASEHLHHSPDCGWAINACIELRNEDKERDEKDPLSEEMMEARRATFMDLWPHDGKRGWTCRTEKMVDAGWYYCPTTESDDFVTCAYCNLSLDGWEPKDNPLDEHHRRSPECLFFTLISRNPVSRNGRRSTRSRMSKSSRLSSMSNLSAFPEAPSLVELEPEEGDSNLTTASTATTSSIAPKGKRKAGKAKKAATSSKGRKIQTKKDEPAVEVPVVEPEDDDFEIKVVTHPPKPVRGRKRASDDMSIAEQPAPKRRQSSLKPPKRRITRTRASKTIDQEYSTLDHRYGASSPITAQIVTGLEPLSKNSPQERVAISSVPQEADEALNRSQQCERMESRIDPVAAVEAELPARPSDTQGNIHMLEARKQSEEPAPAAAPKPALKKRSVRAKKAAAASKSEPNTAAIKEPNPLAPQHKEATPSPSPQSSDAENHPPSSRPASAPRPLASPAKAATARIPLAASTPTASPSKRNIMKGGLSSTAPWTAVDLENAFLASPSRQGDKENLGVDSVVIKAKDALTSPEKKMSVEEWIFFNAKQGEERLRNECERLVGVFENEGVRALRALEGIEV
ncbi:MAG: hypothetical protein M1836_005546 [Candelina mexicana]|nr:MAG: hypothetical protein M1836_005546 [Candelina mexicana]